MIDYTIISILLLSFVGVFVFFLWIGDIRDRDDNAIQVHADEPTFTRLDDTRKDYIFIGNEDKKTLYERLIRAGASNQEALAFIKG